MQVLQGRLTVNRIDNVMRITVEDNLSGKEVIRVEIDPSELMTALTTVALRPCEFRLDTEFLGKRREAKSEKISLADFNMYRLTDQEVTQLLKPYEVDGWVARRQDVNNHHNRDAHGFVKITFVRFVESAEG